MIRPAALLVVAVVSGLLGGAAALIAAETAGVFDDGGATETVVVPSATGEAAPTAASRPLTASGFDPAAIYRERADGVVTLLARFSGSEFDSQGSGFVVTEDGYILTNSHVITTAGDLAGDAAARVASTVFVQFADGDRLPARVVGFDVYNDVGLVKVDRDGFDVTPVPLGDSDDVVVGEPVAAIGSPFGQEGSLSVGVVAATHRSIPSLTSEFDVVGAIQTDAPINRGNSGGPMFDARGRVIGINAQIRSQSGTAEGVGFAIPINSARRSMEQLIETGEVRYAYLGITTQTLTPALARRFGYEQVQRGAAVQTVVPDSPAERANLHGGGPERLHQGVPFRPGGDVVVAIDGQPVETAQDLVQIVTDRLRPGQTVNFDVVRGAERRSVRVTLGERTPDPLGTDR